MLSNFKSAFCRYQIGLCAFVIVIGAALSACTPVARTAVATAAATATPAVFTPQQGAQMIGTCRALKPGYDIGAAPGQAPVLYETAAPIKAYCDKLLAGVVPPTTDANTPSWLASFRAALPEAAAIARVVLPIVATLL